MTGVIRLDFNSGTVKQDIAELPDKIYAATLEVLKERTDLMVGLWKVNSQVDTGAHRDSIRRQWIGKGRKVCIVRAGGYVVNPKTGRLVDYAAILEAKYHAGQRAWNEVMQDIEDMIEARVVERCSK